MLLYRKSGEPAWLYQMLTGGGCFQSEVGWGITWVTLLGQQHLHKVGGLFQTPQLDRVRPEKQNLCGVCGDGTQQCASAGPCEPPAQVGAFRWGNPSYTSPSAACTLAFLRNSRNELISTAFQRGGRPWPAPTPRGLGGFPCAPQMVCTHLHVALIALGHPQDPASPPLNLDRDCPPHHWGPQG